MPLADKRYIYLAGKIKKGHGATQYRGIVAPILKKAGIYSLDPLRGKYVLTQWTDLDPNEVVVRDLQDIERAHVVLAVMMKCEDSSFGTPCEIMYAWERRIPIVMITDEAYLANHFWPRSLCSHIFFVDKDKGDTFESVLLIAANHIAHWYGDTVEQEIYSNPELAIEKPVKGCCGHCNECTRTAREALCEICGGPTPCYCHEPNVGEV